MQLSGNGTRLPRAVALALLCSYLILALASYYSTLHPGFLGLRIATCRESACAVWVMPAGKAWAQGARPGMTVVSADGEDLRHGHAETPPQKATTRAELMGADGRVFQVRVTDTPIGRSPLKYSLWVLGGTFALLGATVLVRRPDVTAARLFAVFAWVTALALGVGPSAGGPSPEWALIVQFLTVLAVGAAFLPFIVAMTGKPSKLCLLLLASFVLAGLILAAGYGLAVSTSPAAYQLLRPVSGIYAAGSIAVGILLLATQVVRPSAPDFRRRAQVALWGTVLSTLPFFGLTIIPESLGQPSLLPAHVTILAIGVMPAALTYGILQYQLLGIRRLVHRGMVYGITSIVLLLLLALGLAVAGSLYGGLGYTRTSQIITAGIVVAGIVLFIPLRNGARWLVDRFIYGDSVDYRAFLQVMRAEAQPASRAVDMANGMAARVMKAMGAEAVLLFLGEGRQSDACVASAGERADDVLKSAYPQLTERIAELRDADLIELRWGPDSLLLANLRWSGQRLGHLVIGPKRGGEVFVQEEQQLMASIIPIISLAVHEAQLSEELREVNRRLVRAEEMERARVASDIHDGPLQKALILARNSPNGPVSGDGGGIAGELVRELREICSRLRPAILDDLGLVPAVEWLLDDAARRSGLHVRMLLRNVDEEERIPRDHELALFRITQEAINNVIKHARATEVEVALGRRGNRLVLEVKDDGVGFSELDVGKGSFGLPSMRERVTQLGGSLDIQSAPGSGTIVTATIPVPEGATWNSR